MTAQIIKRDGRTQAWNKQKIIEAIKKALIAVDGTLTKAGVNMARRVAKNIEKEVFESPEGKEMMKEWGLDEKYVGIGNCLLGYAAAEVSAPAPRKDDYVIYVR